jgi:hypothetical protein
MDVLVLMWICLLFTSVTFDGFHVQLIFCNFLGHNSSLELVNVSNLFHFFWISWVSRSFSSYFSNALLADLFFDKVRLDELNHKQYEPFSYITGKNCGCTPAYFSDDCDHLII